MPPVMNTQSRKWFSTTFQVLYERPERLQKIVLHISKENPEMGSYASDLARLRMSGLVMEDILIRIWNADSVGHVDQILKQQILVNFPCTPTPALAFLADLIKTDLARGCRLHPTVH